jgi:hypothetical protein
LKNEAVIEAQKRRQAQHPNESDSSEQEDQSFKGYLKPINIDLERKVLTKIIQLSKRSLSFYDTTLEEDTDILAADDANK